MHSSDVDGLQGHLHTSLICVINLEAKIIRMQKGRDAKRSGCKSPRDAIGSGCKSLFLFTFYLLCQTK